MKIYSTPIFNWASPRKVAAIYQSHSRPERDKTTEERVMEAKALIELASHYSSIGDEDMRQLTLPFGDDDLIEENSVFEVYKYNTSKGRDRTYSSHITFVRAASMNEAEDLVSEKYPEFWKNSIAVKQADLVAVYTKMDELEKQLEACIDVLGD